MALLEMDDLCDVVLVGHSAGGAVITGVAQRAAEHLAGLVYLDAFVPRPEQSVLDLVTPEWRERFLHEIHTGHDAMVTAPRQLADVLLDAGSAMTSR